MLKPFFVHRLLRARDYQDRAEMAAVCTWWRNLGGVGVCSLEGIGGAGKTSVVERFLRILPGVMPAESGVGKDTSLPAPDAVFVYSFYDAPHPDDLFWNLAAWLLGEGGDASGRTARPPYDRINARLAAVGSVLIVLDGLEKVQDDGSRGRRYGSITEARLRDFLFKAADGQMPNVGVLVTTRFTLEDLTTYDPRAHGANAQGVAPLPLSHRIAVDRLTSGSCRALLQRLGVQGTNRELDRIANHCGFHALTVDLFGGYIVRFLGADASVALSARDAVGMALAPATAEDRLSEYVQHQAARFARVAERYREALARTDPLALTVMQLSCLFRMGVGAELLSYVTNKIFAAATTDGERPLKSVRDVEQKLESLVAMHLLEGTGKSPQGEVIYTTHPAVRDGFLAGLSEDAARRAHGAASERMAGVSLTLRPGERYPSERTTLDQLEEILHHTLKAGHREEARRIYEDRLGGFANLCWALGDYERGERICRSLLQDGASSARLQEEWGLYLVALGRTDAALACLDPKCTRDHAQALGAVLLLAGRLRETVWTGDGEAMDTPERARMALEALEDDELAEAIRRAPLTQGEQPSDTKAYARALLGDVYGALLDFSRLLPSLKWQPSAPLHRRSPFWHLPTLLHCIVLARVGLEEEARRGCNFIRSEVAAALQSETSMYDAAARLVLAEVALSRGDIDDAQAHADAAQSWAVERDARELLSWSWLVRARAANRQASAGGPAARAHSACALDATDAGLRVARLSGFSLYHADLALERAQALLCVGDVDAADYFIRMALYGLVPVEGNGHAYDAPANDDATPMARRGIFPPVDSGLPHMLAITHLHCDYAWGHSTALHLSAEVALLRAARALGSERIDLSALCTSTSDTDALGCAAGFMRQARRHIDSALELRGSSRDVRYPETLALSRRLEETPAMITPYPLSGRQPGGSQAQGAAPVDGPQRRIFISYAHRDNESGDPQHKWLDRLLEHLAPLVHQRDLALWSDRDIGIGHAWHEQIQHSLKHASAAVLMVSPAYLASAYIRNNELPVLLKNAKDQGLPILPVILRPCAFAETRFHYPDPLEGPEEFALASLQAANDLARPLSKMGQAEQDEVLLSVARRLLELSRGEALATPASVAGSGG